ncbi:MULTISPECIES: peptide chain release factor N(5)-glutamine methyltransferase [Halomonadaceae]|uniref:peptide chain release factor N(5)-glutamine methyltransferase n=1 Tax=Halomonadaceae TaxID=28256 RepID=UPI00159B24E2|nr:MULTISPECIES: peptide chain release factor N(5)-glutamine methyltransferase [Halomonas]QJQ96468.1 peptide chain release factor N(5)-glutamine methyltransferase [Halomonas sp. PA5]
MRLDTLLARASQRLAESGSPSARMDTEVLLCHVLGVDRAWLYTWGDRDIGPWERARFEALVAARAAGQPVAYLTGEREFWGMCLKTSSATLIPRPDTETLVAHALHLAGRERGGLLDLGTGTGAIALAFGRERPGWHVLGVDLSAEAVALARDNAQRLAIGNVEFLISDWFAALGEQRFELIVSNPPYLADDDPHLAQGDVRFEPRSALVAGEGGMADLIELVHAARHYLTDGGWLLLEHGHEQGAAVRRAFASAGYTHVETLQDLAGHDRVTLGCCVEA